MPKFYVTKYALSAGIQEFDAPAPVGDKYLTVKVPSGPSYGQTFGPKDWHVDKDKAIARAEQMRIEKIASLEKSKMKLLKLKFA